MANLVTFKTALGGETVVNADLIRAITEYMPNSSMIHFSETHSLIVEGDIHSVVRALRHR